MCLWFVALSAKSGGWVSWLSKGRSRCLHVLWRSYALLVTRFAVGDVWILLGWLMSCNAIWQCFCTCLLLFRCVLFILGLILLCSIVALFFPLLPTCSEITSAFYLHLFAVALGLFGWYLCSCWQMGWYLIGNWVTLEFEFDLSPSPPSPPSISIIVAAIFATYFKLYEFFWSTTLHSWPDLIFFVKC